LVQGNQGPTQIVRLGHRGTPSIDVSDEIAILAARPIASLRWSGMDSIFRFPQEGPDFRKEIGPRYATAKRSRRPLVRVRTDRPPTTPGHSQDFRVGAELLPSRLVAVDSEAPPHRRRHSCQPCSEAYTMANRVTNWTNSNLTGKISATVIFATMAFYGVWTVAVLVETAIRVSH
jgi:hypothetical protein